MVNDGALFFIYFAGAKVGEESLEGSLDFLWGTFLKVTYGKRRAVERINCADMCPLAS